MQEALIGIFGVFVGGIVAAGTQVWINRQQQRDNTQILKKSLRAEIKALIAVVQVERFQEEMENLKKRSEEETSTWWHMNISAREDFFPIYSQNVTRLGLLTTKQAESVITFYTFTKVWLENMRIKNNADSRDEAIKQLAKNIESLQRIQEIGHDTIKLL